MTNNFKDNPSRWKYGGAKYFFHTPLEYKIVQKGTDVYSPNVSANEIKIRPVSIGPYKHKTHRINFKEGGIKEINIENYSFWIPRRRIRRGARSWSQTKDRWVHKKTFDECLGRAVRGISYFKNYY
jgi:hypothetical protein